MERMDLDFVSLSVSAYMGTATRNAQMMLTAILMVVTIPRARAVTGETTTATWILTVIATTLPTTLTPIAGHVLGEHAVLIAWALVTGRLGERLQGEPITAAATTPTSIE